MPYFAMCLVQARFDRISGLETVRATYEAISMASVVVF